MFSVRPDSQKVPVDSSAQASVSVSQSDPSNRVTGVAEAALQRNESVSSDSDSREFFKALNDIRTLSLFNPILSGNIEDARRLAERETSSWRDHNGKRAIMFAAEVSVEMLMIFVSKSIEQIGLRDREGRTVLMYAAKKGKIEVVKHLVETLKVNVEDTDKSGFTALFYAVNSKSEELVKYLVEKGADFQHKNQGGMTLLITAILAGSLSMVKYLVGTLKMEVNPPDTARVTPLICACLENRLEIVKYLVEQGADLNSSVCDGEEVVTALSISKQEEHTEIITYLEWLTAGAAAAGAAAAGAP